ncbi:S-layer homology domain-containing protein [Paenibacillus sp. N3/727]|uniref:S-layer homology domain-containing protein n=1 Tax=Paenibacillus sp. N3/727 TaxID=2925845 RepID=UPI001F52C1E9|nr:S-layer homology domain-containing protein [Paenibacillus sp. N3/727]UNK17587.1 S-layer homology domain-containing protein [Paenibacillus sp. N3/727]
MSSTFHKARLRPFFRPHRSQRSAQIKRVPRFDPLLIKAEIIVYVQSWIEKAMQAGIVTGFADHTYRPDQVVTPSGADRDIGTGAEAPSFTDEARIDKWAADAVKSAMQVGWITGYSDGSFRPQEGITRVELAAVLARTTQGDVVGSGQLSKFRDAEQIPVWAQS